jgi:hypothetical protein
MKKKSLICAAAVFAAWALAATPLLAAPAPGGTDLDLAILEGEGNAVSADLLAEITNATVQQAGQIRENGELEQTARFADTREFDKTEGTVEPSGSGGPAESPSPGKADAPSAPGNED